MVGRSALAEFGSFNYVIRHEHRNPFLGLGAIRVGPANEFVFEIVMGPGKLATFGLSWLNVFLRRLRRNRTGIVGSRSAIDNRRGSPKIPRCRRSSLSVSSGMGVGFI